MIRLFLIIAAVLSNSALASDWELFGKTDTVTSYVDRASRSRVNTVYTAWFKTVHTKPQKMRRPGSVVPYTEKLELVRMDCANRHYSIDKTVYKANDGATVGTDDGTERHEPVVPDSPSELRHVALCGKNYTSLDALSDQGIRYHPVEERKSKWNPFTK